MVRRFFTGANIQEGAKGNKRVGTKDILKEINVYRSILCITLSVFQVPLPFYAVK